MRKNILHTLILSSAIVALLSGCTGNELAPNNATQTGAVTGALAGSIIGYNTGNGGGTNAAIGGLLGTAVGAGIGNAVDDSNAQPAQTGGWQ
ncbi:MAG TPA: hypothetical protein ENJ34_03705 [Epsilonproteobacteria bacterium]|nr:hypothetical protein [Campylobacterota bacterium]